MTSGSSNIPRRLNGALDLCEEIAESFPAIEALEKHGYFRLPFQFAEWQAARAWLQGQPTTESYHVHQPPSRNFRGYRPETVVRCPYLLDLFNDRRILDIVDGFIDARPTLYSVNAWWSLVAQIPEGKWIQEWHRDHDDDKPFVVLFVALTDVDRFSGATELRIDATHSVLQGRAGTMWLVDTRHEHRGLVPQRHDRLMAWARYGHGPNKNSADLEMKPLPAAEVPTRMTGRPGERHVNRLLVEWT